MNIQNLKGFRDFLPQEAKKRNYVLSTLKKVFESYGFDPLETPTLEYEEILTGKYGDEGDKLMYKFVDNGERKVAMRYDQTVPLARVVAQYQNDLAFPFKRYQIQNVWRAENTQKGRYREFLQVDADIVGSSSPLSDAEIITLTGKCMQELGFTDFTIKVNDRINFKDIDPKAITIVDKLDKIGPTEVQKQLKENGFDENLLLEIKNEPAPDRLNSITDAVYELDKKLEGKLKYKAELARGLDYYTGLIFEVEVSGYQAGSIAGGGRYDNLIGMFAGKDIPAVGFAFGFDRLLEAMEELDLFPKDLKGNDFLIAFASSDLQEKAMKIAQELRDKEINAEFYLEDADLEKQLKYANKKQIPYMLIVNNDKLIFKNMGSGEQKEVKIEDIKREIK